MTDTRKLATWRRAYNHAVNNNRPYARIATLMGVSTTTVARYVNQYADHLRRERAAVRKEQAL